MGIIESVINWFIREPLMTSREIPQMIDLLHFHNVPVLVRDPGEHKNQKVEKSFWQFNSLSRTFWTFKYTGTRVCGICDWWMDSALTTTTRARSAEWTLFFRCPRLEIPAAVCDVIANRYSYFDTCMSVWQVGFLFMQSAHRCTCPNPTCHTWLFFVRVHLL